MKKSTMRNSIFLAQLLLSQNVVAFFAANSCRGSIKSNKISTEARMFFAEEVNESDSPSIKKEKSMEAEDKPHSLQVDLVSSDDAQFLNMAGSFLVGECPPYPLRAKNKFHGQEPKCDLCF
jgi:hypothetical protein